MYANPAIIFGFLGHFNYPSFREDTEGKRRTTTVFKEMSKQSSNQMELGLLEVSLLSPASTCAS